MKLTAHSYTVISNKHHFGITKEIEVRATNEHGQLYMMADAINLDTVELDDFGQPTEGGVFDLVLYSQYANPKNIKWVTYDWECFEDNVLWEVLNFPENFMNEKATPISEVASYIKALNGFGEGRKTA